MQEHANFKIETHQSARTAVHRTGWQTEYRTWTSTSNASTAADIQLLTKSEVMLLSGALEKFSTRIYLSFASFFGVNNLLEGISQHRHLNHLDSVLFSKE